ncbi:hypothetical protein BC826DRAFT_1139434 [Russula brevipes]|nr:hypothetical protein BC826DRAFT_1139434 [Russula brevipes]
MPSIKKFKQRPSLSEDVDISLNKKNKLKNAKLIRGARDQLENLACDPVGSEPEKSLKRPFSRADVDTIAVVGEGAVASCVQDHSTGYAQDLDELRSLWMSGLQLCEALSGLLSSEEEMTRKLELDREKNSVVYLAQAKADCEGIISLIFAFFLSDSPKS